MADYVEIEAFKFFAVSHATKNQLKLSVASTDNGEGWVFSAKGKKLTVDLTTRVNNNGFLKDVEKFFGDAGAPQAWLACLNNLPAKAPAPAAIVLRPAATQTLGTTLAPQKPKPEPAVIQPAPKPAPVPLTVSTVKTPTPAPQQHWRETSPKITQVTARQDVKFYVEAERLLTAYKALPTSESNAFNYAYIGNGTGLISRKDPDAPARAYRILKEAAGLPPDFPNQQQAIANAVTAYLNTPKLKRWNDPAKVIMEMAQAMQNINILELDQEELKKRTEKRVRDKANKKQRREALVLGS